MLCLPHLNMISSSSQFLRDQDPNNSLWFIWVCAVRWRSESWTGWKMNDYGAPKEKNQNARKQTCPIVTFPPQIPHGLTYDRIRASATNSLWLRAWIMVRLLFCINLKKNFLGFVFTKYFNLRLLNSRKKPAKTGNVRILSKDMVLSNYKVPKGVSIHIIILWQLSL